MAGTGDWGGKCEGIVNNGADPEKLIGLFYEHYAIYSERHHHDGRDDHEELHLAFAPSPDAVPDAGGKSICAA
jgi:hypothetical protein